MPLILIYHQMEQLLLQVRQVLMELKSLMSALMVVEIRMMKKLKI